MINHSHFCQVFYALILFSSMFFFGCKSTTTPQKSNVVTSDIDLFWNAFDSVLSIQDSALQVHVFDSMYTKQGTEGLAKLMEVRRYTSEEYVDLINLYPAFWNSLRDNTYKASELSNELNEGIRKLEKLYAPLKPAKIYFGVGCMRTNGTTQEDKVLIGSELAMMDASTDVSEFDDQTRNWLQGLIDTDPINGVVLLNVHEYVHTQQHPISDQLLYQTLYEGVAEFISTQAMNSPSASPAIAFGKNNPDVKKAFEKEMFYNYTFNWLWSNYPNQFGVRDLSYFIGYEMAEKYYNQQQDKRAAIKTLIELDYADTDAIDSFIDDLQYFSKPIDVLRKDDAGSRPKVVSIQQFENGSNSVNPNTKRITFVFSEPLNGTQTGVDLGPLGRNAFPTVSNRYWAEDNTSWTMDVDLEPNKTYQILISNNFRTDNSVALFPYLLEFKTAP